MTSDLSRNVKSRSREFGILETGICSSSALPENRASLDQILPGHRSVVCILVPHCQAALASHDLSVKQSDTAFTYEEVTRTGHLLARYLESEGHPSVSVPAYLPLDMSDDKLGMVGAIDWRRAAGLSGLAVRGESGLAVNPRYGPRMRIGGVLTTAELKPDKPLDSSPCEGCRLCVKACPAGALKGEGQIDRRLCGENLFASGLRAFTRLLVAVATAESKEKAKEVVYSQRAREVWQALETGSYYSCWACQNACPVGQAND
ncbi:4Fe-4S double cluster binding domain-containing protein [Chloroflexota bacterium]